VDLKLSRKLYGLLHVLSKAHLLPDHHAMCPQFDNFS